MNVQYDAYVMYSANSMLLCSCLGSSMSRCIHGSGCVSCDIRADAGVCVSGDVVGFGGNGEEEASVEEEEEDEEDEGKDKDKGGARFFASCCTVEDEGSSGGEYGVQASGCTTI